eukprot:5124347-Prymnesium_polylepis.1
MVRMMVAGIELARLMVAREARARAAALALETTMATDLGCRWCERRRKPCRHLRRPVQRRATASLAMSSTGPGIPAPCSRPQGATAGAAANAS